eukprot:454517_1
MSNLSFFDYEITKTFQITGINNENTINFSKLLHDYDPLGIIYEAIESSFIITSNNIPIGIILHICSYLEYVETTMKAKEAFNTCTIAPIQNSYELMCVIHPPKHTLLPNNIYVLTDIIFPFRGPIHRQSKYYIGIQLFDKNNYEKPGKGNIIYKSDIMNSFDVDNKDEKMCKLLSLHIELKCEQSYLLFIQQAENKTYSAANDGLCISLVNAQNVDNKDILDKLKFCSTMFWYTDTQYQTSDEYMNFFQMCFSCKG